MASLTAKRVLGPGWREVRLTRRLLDVTLTLLCCAFLLYATTASAQDVPPMTLWHAYRGAEEAALGEALAVWNERHPERPVKAQSLPYEVFSSKITNGIPRGNGPDLFIAAHESLGEWSRAGLLEPWEEGEAPWASYHETTVEALRYGDKRWGVPLATKSLVLFYNTALVKEPPATTDALIASAKAHTDQAAGRYGLAYEAANFYMHAPWLFGFGGQIFSSGSGGDFVLNSKEAADSYRFAARLVNQERIVPEDASGALVGTLFNEGKAAYVISGPWFMGEINKEIRYALAPLPKVSETGLPAKPFLTVEAAFVSSQSTHKQEARALALFLASDEIAALRAVKGLQPVATLETYARPEVARLAQLKVFREQLDAAVPMPNDPRMRSVWEPANQALRQVLRGAVEADVALGQAAFRYKIYTRPAPPAAPIAPFLAIIGVALALGLGYSVTRLRAAWPSVIKNKHAYLYLAPAALGMLFLVVAPFLVGSAVSLFAHQGGEFTFVGFRNFLDIILSKDYGFMDPLSFYYTLTVTVAWTAVNVFFHVSLGLVLALLLREPWLKLRGLYRVLLIIPWAVPNYITALIWKGMFHKQFGAINGILTALGAEPISWFSQFATAFAANVATNTWLGFPFMMVVILGALQAIPKDLEEAAEVDGATRWQRLQHVVFPLLKPALVPAVILGTVWTFNMFNIIYLVSGGEPDGSTEILISEAYKWAFQRQQQYGYASAYAVLIFLVLLVYSWATGQLKNRD
jgi:arabinogalactan oligomer/maltooligosaccharide transport system permease protein